MMSRVLVAVVALCIAVAGCMPTAEDGEGPDLVRIAVSPDVRVTGTLTEDEALHAAVSEVILGWHNPRTGTTSERGHAQLLWMGEVDGEILAIAAIVDDEDYRFGWLLEVTGPEDELSVTRASTTNALTTAGLIPVRSACCGPRYLVAFNDPPFTIAEDSIDVTAQGMTELLEVPNCSPIPVNLSGVDYTDLGLEQDFFPLMFGEFPFSELDTCEATEPGGLIFEAWSLASYQLGFEPAQQVERAQLAPVAGGEISLPGLGSGVFSIVEWGFQHPFETESQTLVWRGSEGQDDIHAVPDEWASPNGLQIGDVRTEENWTALWWNEPMPGDELLLPADVVVVAQASGLAVIETPEEAVTVRLTRGGREYEQEVGGG